MPKATEIHSTTQIFLDIYDITNDMLIMKSGATAMILAVSAMNFGLLAEEEQDAIIYAYAGLLNSLNYPIQIVIRSQTKDATKYLNLLKEQEEKASDRQKSDSIRRYREFVSNLIHERNVLDKKFYVVIPASALEMGLLPPQSVVPGVKQLDISTIERSVILEKARNILEPKRDHLIGQFGRIGLAARQLATQEIIQLFYTSYNPEAAEGQQITNTSDYTTSLVQAQSPDTMSLNQGVPTSPRSYPMTDNPQTPTPPAPASSQSDQNAPVDTTFLGGALPTTPSGGVPAAASNPPNPAVPPAATASVENPTNPTATTPPQPVTPVSSMTTSGPDLNTTSSAEPAATSPNPNPEPAAAAAMNPSTITPLTSDNNSPAASSVTPQMSTPAAGMSDASPATPANSLSSLNASPQPPLPAAPPMSSPASVPSASPMTASSSVTPPAASSGLASSPPASSDTSTSMKSAMTGGTPPAEDPQALINDLVKTEPTTEVKTSPSPGSGSSSGSSSAGGSSSSSAAPGSDLPPLPEI